jgi:hypothetical protein
VEYTSVAKLTRRRDSLMELPVALGFFGDTINFVAAGLLAWDPLRRKRVYLKQQADARLPPEIQFFDHKNNPVPRGEALEKVLVSGETNRTRFGYVLLILGFTALFVARILETRGEHPQCSQIRACVSPQTGR